MLDAFAANRLHYVDYVHSTTIPCHTEELCLQMRKSLINNKIRTVEGGNIGYLLRKNDVAFVTYEVYYLLCYLCIVSSLVN
jgi:hypothetical protein